MKNGSRRPHRVGLGLLLAEQFGVKRGSFSLSPTKRSTFVIDTDSTVLAVIHSEVSMNQHADRALATLRERTA